MSIIHKGGARNSGSVALIATAVVAVGLLVAPVYAQSGPSIKGTTITFGGWGGEEGATKSYFDAFRSSFTQATGADVQWVGASYDQTQQQLALRATADPIDVAQIDIGWITSFASKGQLVDLNTVFGQSTLEALYPKNYLALGQYQGKQVALPWTIASISLVANMDVLNKAGITDVPKTTQEFADDLAKIKQAEPDVIPYALNTKTSGLVSPFLEPWLWTFGGNIYKDGKVAVSDGTGIPDALTYLTGLVNKGLVQKDMDIFSARTLFAQGKVAFYDDAIIARGLVTDPDRAKAVMPVARPVVLATDQPQSIQWGHALVMFAKQRSPEQLEAAKQFLSWLEDPKQSADYFTSQGLLPATVAGLANQKADAYATAWAKVTSTSRPDETAAFPNGAAIADIIGQHGEAAYNGIETPQAATQGMGNDLAQLAQ